MGFFDWMTRHGNESHETDANLSRTDENHLGSEPESAPQGEYLKPDGDSLPFRFRKPFTHLYPLMSPEERELLDAVEARFKERYEQFRNYPPMSEGQEHELTVFKAIDKVHRAMDARKDGRPKDWNRLEAVVNHAVGGMQKAFMEQRLFVHRESVLPGRKQGPPKSDTGVRNNPPKRQSGKGHDIRF
jgi:hypothetical protein